MEIRYPANPPRVPPTDLEGEPPRFKDDASHHDEPPFRRFAVAIPIPHSLVRRIGIGRGLRGPNRPMFDGPGPRNRSSASDDYNEFIGPGISSHFPSLPSDERIETRESH